VYFVAGVKNINSLVVFRVSSVPFLNIGITTAFIH